MRHAHRPCYTLPFSIAAWLSVVALAGCLASALASLWHASWVSPSGATRIKLAQGALSVWSGSPGDFPAGLRVGGWSGDALLLKPMVETRQGRWVTRPGSAIATQLTGLSIRIPMYLPLIPLGASTGMLWFPRARRRRRIALGRCAACGYDLRGSSGRCPECGCVPPQCRLRRVRSLESAALWGRPRAADIATG